MLESGTEFMNEVRSKVKRRLLGVENVKIGFGAYFRRKQID